MPRMRDLSSSIFKSNSRQRTGQIRSSHIWKHQIVWVNWNRLSMDCIIGEKANGTTRYNISLFCTLEDRATVLLQTAGSYSFPTVAPEWNEEHPWLFSENLYWYSYDVHTQSSCQGSNSNPNRHKIQWAWHRQRISTWNSSCRTDGKHKHPLTIVHVS